MSSENNQRLFSEPKSQDYARHQCDICYASFSRPNHVLRHKKNVHKVIDSADENRRSAEEDVSVATESFKCRVCDSRFSQLSNRRRHEKNQHGLDSGINQQMKRCSECTSTFSTRADIMNHISCVHNHIKLPVKSKVCSSIEEFQEWKLALEEETSSSFTKQRTTQTKLYSVCDYYCHRSGVYSSRSNNVRHQKMLGSNKTGYFCPAYIQTRKCADSNSIQVSYIDSHLGHDCEVGRLRLPANDKDKIAGLLHAGVPISTVMQQISTTASPTKRLAATTPQDLRNIISCYGLKSHAMQNMNDVVSVDSWVKQMQSSSSNPILCYKLPGDCNEDYPNLRCEDFLLGFMNDAQEEILKLYGSDVILIDSTHGTTMYDIQLTSVLVKDSNMEGFPVAFLWSNRQTEDVFTYFFSGIKRRINMISPRSFMSDDYPAFYNAWRKVFSEAEFHLICDWHIKRSLLGNLQSGEMKVNDAQKRAEMHIEVENMINEVCEKTFLQMMEANVSKWLSEEACIKYARYFISNYANRPKQWAACYRVGAHVNTNMICERWHKELKYNSNLNGKCGGRLDLAIDSIISSLRKKMTDRLSSLHRGKYTKKIACIRNRHKLAEEYAEKSTIIDGDESTWYVASFSLIGEYYTIKKNEVHESHKCNVKCDSCTICLHQFSCSCPDAAIKYNICKHIHVLCIKKRFTCISPIFEDEPLNSLVVCEPENNNVRETLAISDELRKSQTLRKENLKEKALSALFSLVPEIDKFTTEEQYEEVIKTVSALKSRCNALSTVKEQLQPVTGKVSSTKHIEPQRRFPTKRKNCGSKPSISKLAAVIDMKKIKFSDAEAET